MYPPLLLMQYVLIALVCTPNNTPIQILVRALCFTVDPYMRPKMELTKNFTERYEVGKCFYGDGIGRVCGGQYAISYLTHVQVMNSKNGNFKEGDLVWSPMLHWKEIEVYSAKDIKDRSIVVLDTLVCGGIC